MLGVHQFRQRRAVAVLAQMPGREPAELTLGHQPAGLGHAGVPEIGRVDEDRREDRAGILVCPAGAQVREAGGEPRPTFHLGQQVGDRDGGQVRIEGCQRALRLVGRDRAQRRDAQPSLDDAHVLKRIDRYLRLDLGETARQQRPAFRQPGCRGVDDRHRQRTRLPHGGEHGGRNELLLAQFGQHAELERAPVEPRRVYPPPPGRPDVAEWHDGKPSSTTGEAAHGLDRPGKRGAGGDGPEGEGADESGTDLAQDRRILSGQGHGIEWIGTNQIAPSRLPGPDHPSR